MSIQYDYKGKIAVVTGSAKGIGKGIAEAFARAGANVVIADFDEVSGKETAAELEALGVKTLFCKTDVSSAESVNAMRDATLETFGHVDFLINNAGIATKHPGPPLNEIPANDFELLFHVNVMGVVHCCQAFYDNFVSRKSGKIVNTASIAGYKPSATLPQYSTCKSAIIMLSACIAMELGPHNINVNTLNPGYVYTDIYAKGGAAAIASKMPQAFGDLTEGEDIVRRIAAGSYMKRMQTVEDMANTVLFLCSDEAQNITGQAINVDGGVIY